MKKIIYSLALLILSVSACKKTDPIGEFIQPPLGVSSESSVVYYIDTAHIYSTDLKGANQKRIVDESVSKGTSFIRDLQFIPKENKLLYYYGDYLNPAFLKTCNLDGSGIKIIKTWPANYDRGISPIKATADGRIIYQTYKFGLNATITDVKIMSLKADGTDEKEITGTPFNFQLDQNQISGDVRGIIREDGYFNKLKEGIVVEAESFDLFSNEDKARLAGNPIISSDGTKVLFVQTTASETRYEIKIKDVVKGAPVGKLLYTLNYKPDADKTKPYAIFVSGTKSVLTYHGKHASPKGAPTDFTDCDLIDVSSGIAPAWRFAGRDASLTTN